MKGLIVDATGKLSIADLDMPAIGDYHALVKTVSCGVCNGTDGKLIHGSFKDFTTYPAMLGHEAVGRVVKVGAKVRHLSEGDHVLLPFLEESTNGYYSGWGGYAEYGVVCDGASMQEDGLTAPESAFAQSVLPTGIDPVKGAMIITFREVLSAIYRFGIKANEPVVVYGAGPVGLCFIRFLKLLGCAPVISVEIDDGKLAEARRMGADIALNSKSCDVVRAVREIFPDGVENIVDAAGVNALINQAMELVKYNGKICCYGISPHTSMHLDWSKAPYNWQLLFVQWPSKKEEGAAHNQVLAWLEAGAIRLDDFISEVAPFQQILDVFERVLAGKTEKKIIIRYE